MGATVLVEVKHCRERRFNPRLAWGLADMMLKLSQVGGSELPQTLPGTDQCLCGSPWLGGQSPLGKVEQQVGIFGQRRELTVAFTHPW